MALQASFSSSSYSSSSNGFSYDVFLSFRGTDTRYGFTGYLYKTLRDNGMDTFIDDEELEKGEEITPSLVDAIQESRIAILVFSTNYASSSFCLDELVTIMECFRANGRLVLPVFYNVDPSDVRHQKGSYGEAMAKHEERFKDDMQKVQKWRMALHQVANLAGYHYTHRDGYEHVFIEKIVEGILSRKIKHVILPVADFLVGLESRVSKVTSLLDVGSSDGVQLIGIHGIGGIGKTTLAHAVCNWIANHFECTCFLEDVRETSNKHGLERLRSVFVYELLGENKIKLAGVQQEISIIKRRLSRKKVLLILDDVDKWDQLHAIVGKLNWFGPSSRIIITTRDKQLLAYLGVERTYELEGLDEAQALELLSWKAFKTINVNPIYRDVLDRAVTYACGLPLALEVLGSSLFGKSVKQWESALERYEKIPSSKIHNILKVSYEALEKDQRSVFLDITCCFEDYTLPEVEDILHAHYGDCMEYHLRVLIEKSLIKIVKIIDIYDIVNWISLHDLIKGMGREIVRQESCKRPGKRSRLWFHEDIVQVLEDNQGTNEIEIIHLEMPFREKIEWDGKALKRMENLKTLVIRNCHFSQGPKHLPKSLRILEWENYPSQSLPRDFHPRKLSMLKLPGNCLTSLELAALFKKFVNLKVLDLAFSKCLIEIPDVSDLPNLEELVFNVCRNLTTIHSSVGFLDKLRIMEVSNCSQLRTFPPIKLTSLERLHVRYCRSLENFPEVIGKMENITEISLEGTPIKELPFSFQNLTRLRRLDVCGTRISFRMPSSFVMMPELVEIHACRLDEWLSPKQEEGEETVSSTVSSNVERLSLSKCNLLDDFFTTGLKWFANVKELCLYGNNSSVISACIKECRFLKKLIVDDCQHLREIRGVPPNLEQFSARNCRSLTSSCTSMLLSQELHEAGNTSFIVPVERIPEWFEHRSRGPSISFWFRNNLPALALSVVAGGLFSNMYHQSIHFRPSVIINGKKSEGLRSFIIPTMDHIFLCGLQKIKFNDNFEEALLENEWNHAEVSYAVKSWGEEKFNGVPLRQFVKECGIHVFKQKSNMEDIQFTDPYKRRKLDGGLNSPES